MPVLTPQQALLLGFILAPILFALSAYFTRATRRRIIGALAGAIAYGLSNFLWDQFALAHGWWTYPSFAASHLLPILYVPSGLVAGGAFGLIGWRVTRRFGRSGLGVFLIAWSIWGVLHDYLGAAAFASSNLMAFGSGMVPFIADLLLYGFCQMMAQLGIRLVGGPMDTDPLARSIKPAQPITKGVVQ